MNCANCANCVNRPSQVAFYYLSEIGSERDKRMINRFEIVKIPAKRVECVPRQWLEEKGYDNPAYGCMWGHLKMLIEFLNNSDKEFGMFFENDVYISRSLPSDISFLCNRMKLYDLDILLTGYLIDYDPGNCNNSGNENVDIDTIGFYQYDYDLWGSQSYIVTRKHAQYLVNKYTEDYLKQTLLDSTLTPFSADWTITKDGNKALVYPMYAVEEGNINALDIGHINFHKSCTAFNYKPHLYV